MKTLQESNTKISDIVSMLPIVKAKEGGTQKENLYLNEHVRWSTWKCLAAMGTGLGLLALVITDADRLNRMVGGTLAGEDYWRKMQES